MAARRGRKKMRRRRDNRFNLMSAIETVVYGSIITEAAFQTSLVGFFTEGAGQPGRSLKDILANPEESFDSIAARLTNPEVILGAAVKSFTVGFLFNLYGKALSKPRRKVNAGLKQLGVPVKM